MDAMEDLDTNFDVFNKLMLNFANWKVAFQ